MRVIHLANWNSTNIGNGALGLGMERVLKEDLGGDVVFHREAWDDYTFGLKAFDRKFVELLNNNCDVFMVNGAVTFNSFRRRMFNAGFRFDLPLELWKEIKVPIVFYGISYMNFAKQPYPNTPIIKKTLEHILSNNRVLFAVRNDGTKAWIEKTIGVTSDRIYEVPDPGLYVPKEEGKSYYEINPEKKNVIIAFNNESEVYRYGGKTREILWTLLVPLFGDEKLEHFFKRWFAPLIRKNRRAIVKQLAYACKRIIKEFPSTQFILAPHYLDDYAMVGDFINLVDERIAHQLTVSTGLLKISGTEFFYGRYAKADLVLAMRIHSMSPSIGLNIPVIPLTYAGRMGAFLKNAGLSHIALDLFRDFEDLLVAKATELLRDPSMHKKELATATQKLRIQTKKFNETVLRPFLTKTGSIS